MTALWRADRGSATAELAVLMPSLLLVLGLCLTGVRVAATQLIAQDAAADAARSAARGDPPGVGASRVAAAVPGATVTRQETGGLLCVRVRAPTALGLEVTAASCAWAGGG